MPDHRRGYVHRGDGIRPPDEHMGELYRGNLKQAVVRFDGTKQQQLVQGALDACEHQDVRCHFIATEPTHVHVLVSWNSDRTWQIVRKQVRGCITRLLNESISRQQVVFEESKSQTSA
jgi:hypothetical protein